MCEIKPIWASLQEAGQAEKDKRETGSSLGMGSLEDPLIQNVGMARDVTVSDPIPPPLNACVSPHSQCIDDSTFVPSIKHVQSCLAPSEMELCSS